MAEEKTKKKNTNVKNKKKNNVTTTKNKVATKKSNINIKKDTIVEKKKEDKIKKEETKGFKKVLFGKNHSLFDMLFFIIIVAIASVLLTSQYVVHKYKGRGIICNSTLSKDKDLNEFNEVYKEVIDNYYQEVDKKKMVESAIDGMLSFLEDNYSIHMNSDQSDMFDDNLEGTYQGIGIVMQGNEIIEIYEPSPAKDAGLKVGDVVVELGGEELTAENTYDVVQKVRKEMSDKLKIVYEREGKRIEKEIDVKTVNLPIVTSNFVDINKKRIGYIKISSFTSNSFEQFSEQLVNLEEKDKIEKLIIDVRDNGGGYLEQAADIASLFVEKGKVIYSLEDRKTKEVIKDKTKDNRKYEVVVLINGGSASASEILATALKDNNEAILVGEKSYGKGKVQTTKKLEDGTILKYTSSRWLRPNGDCVDGEGIKPDYEVAADSEKDLQYEKAISLMK